MIAPQKNSGPDVALDTIFHEISHTMDAQIIANQRVFLSQAYNFKAVADYETGSAELSAKQANTALERGRGFVDAVHTVLTPPKPA